MNTIKRDVYVLRNTIKIPIEVTKGTDAISFEFTVRDYNLPATVAAVAYAYRMGMKKPNSTLCDVSGNVISFQPGADFFEVGMNELQIRVINEEKSLISFKEKVKCSDTIGFPDEEEEKQQTLVEQLVSYSGKETGERKAADEAEKQERIVAINTEKAERIAGDAQEKVERQAEIATERARINQFTKLAAGSTTGDAELIDGRTDVDGNVHDNIGDAMRGQTRKLRENLVVRQKEQPTDPNNNVWISDEDDEVEVPDMGEFNFLKEDIIDVSDGLKIYTVTPSWEQGNVTQNTEQEAGNKIRTGFIDTKQAKKLKTEISDGYVVQILLYDKTQKYISSSNKSYTGKIERALDDEVYFIRMVVYRSTWGDIFPSDAKSYIENVLFYCPNGYVKTTEISKVNKAYIMLDFDYSFYVADKSVGDGGLMCVREDLLAEYGFKGTLAVNYTAMSSEMQQIILNTFKKYNWEYALYGLDGTSSEFDSQIRPYISDNSYINEITSHLENYVNKFNEYGLYEPIIYFCRRNENGSALMEAAQNNGIKLMRAITFNEKEIETTYDGYEIPVNMTISTYQVYYNNFDWSSLKSKIDEHINNGGFMSIMTHRLWSNISKGSQSEDNTIENYRTILDYIKSLVDNGSVEVITWKDVYNIIHDENNTITKTDYNRLLKRIEALETA